jgi:hypothetical protein
MVPDASGLTRVEELDFIEVMPGRSTCSAICLAPPGNSAYTTERSRYSLMCSVVEPCTFTIVSPAESTE